MGFTIKEIVSDINRILEHKLKKEENVSFNYILKILSNYFPINKININKKSNKFHLYVCSQQIITFVMTRKHLINNQFTHISINAEQFYNDVNEDSINTDIVEKLEKNWGERKNAIEFETQYFIDMLKKKFNLDLYDFNIIIKEYESLDFLSKEYLKSEALLKSIELYIKKEDDDRF